MAVTELRISLAPLPGCLPTDDVDSALRAASGNAAGLRDVRLEPVGSALVLTLAFDSPVDVQVRPAPDFLGLDVAVVGQVTMARARARAPVRTATPPPLPSRTLPTADILEKQWTEAKAAFDAGDNPAA